MEMKPRHGLAFATLCLLSGSTWIIDQFYPGMLTGPIHTAAHEGLLAILFAALSMRSRRPLTRRLILELALCGIALFALPTILSAGSGGSVASLTVILISTFIPTIVVFLAAQASDTNDDNPMRLLLPALAGLGGAALILPFTWPPTPHGQVWIIAIVVSAIFSALAAVRLRALLRQIDIVRALAVLCASAAVVSAFGFRIGFSSLGDWTDTQLLIEILRCLLLEAPVLYLLVYLLREMNPVAISTRYLLVPLVTIVESYLLERPQTNWTTFAGVLLMAGSAAILIRTPSPGNAL